MPETVFEVFDATARAHAERPAMSRKRAGSWEHTSWREYHDAVGRAARALVALGVEPGAGVVILAANRPEWFVTSLATAMVGARTVGIYTNSTPEQVRFIADHAEATLALVDSKAALAKLEGAGGRPSRLKTVVLLEESPAGQGVLSWADFLAKGEEAHAAEVARRRQALTGATVSTLIYTSGTTGAPKAVMLTQRNLAFIAEKIQELVPVGGAAGDRLISYLPLSHIAEQVVSHLLSIATGAHVYFAESLEKLGDNLREVRPHFFLGVPRVWEKIQAGIQAAGAAASPLRKRIAAWARGVGRAAGDADQAGRPRPWSYGLADRLVFRKVRARLGLDQARMLCVSSAPIAKETLDFFQSLGLPDHGGLRHERVHRARDDVAARALPARARRLRDPGHRDPDRGGRRGADRAARTCSSATTRTRRRRARRSTRRAGSTRATSARSTPRASCASPTARRS